MMARRAATYAPAAQGVDSAISACAAQECSRVPGQELTEGGGKLHLV